MIWVQDLIFKSELVNAIVLTDEKSQRRSQPHLLRLELSHLHKFKSDQDYSRRLVIQEVGRRAFTL